MRSSDLFHQDSTMVRFDIWLPRQLSPQHRKVVGDNGIELIIVPRFSDLLFVSHTLTLREAEVV